MASFVDKSYNALLLRSGRIVDFYSDLESNLGSIGAPYTNHLDIYWDGSKVKILATDEQISTLENKIKLKYYNQGLGLMKLAMNNKLFA
jgi:hypothetical protein